MKVEEKKPYRVLRGSNQIGGSVVEIISEKGTRIWIDFGSELSVDEELSTDEKLIALMKEETTRPKAIFFTHIHGDHIGLLPYVEKGVKVFIGKLGKEMLDNIHKTLLNHNHMDAEEKDKIEKMNKLLNNKEITTFYSEKPTECNFEDIKFTALRVDHSVYDSYMLKFEVDGKVIVHTGDFRTHGRLGENLIPSIQKYITNEKVDILFMEGTMMSRLGEKVMTEEDMEKEAFKILEKHKYAFLICSSTNIDTLASFYRAAVSRKNKRAFYCNSYVKRQLELYTKEIGEKEDLWEYKFYRSYPIKAQLNWKLKNGQTQEEYMKENGFVMMVGTSDYYRELMEKFRDCNPILIYSMWNGYLKENKPYSNKQLKDLVDAWEPNVRYLHTSGHATADALAQVIKTIDPREAIVPIHTDNAKGFYTLDIDNKYRKIIETKTDIVPDNFDFKFATENDSRAFIDINHADEDTEMMKALKEGGCLHSFVELVKDKEELELCFRGNTGKQCSIYYNNHEFFKISLVNHQPRLSFNMNHARYWHELDARNGFIKQKKELNHYGLIWKESDDQKNRWVISDGRLYTRDDLEALYKIRKKMMKSYFSIDENDLNDVFVKERRAKITDKLKVEKKEQQKIMSNNTNCKNGYYVYDMEYAQPFKSKKVREIYKNITGDTKQNKPDLLAIRFEEGKPKALVFIELKSTEAAMKGKSGAISHMIGMRNYVENSLNKEFIDNRKKEAYGMMLSYQQLGIHNCNCHIVKEDFENISEIELLLVLTDNMSEDLIELTGSHSAKYYYDKNKKVIDKVAKSTSCRILVLEKNNFVLK